MKLATEGYDQATWRRQVLRVVARDNGWTDRQVARAALGMSDDDLRRHLWRSMAIVQTVKALRESYGRENSAVAFLARKTRKSF